VALPISFGAARNSKSHAVEQTLLDVSEAPVSDIRTYPTCVVSPFWMMSHATEPMFISLITMDRALKWLFASQPTGRGRQLTFDALPEPDVSYKYLAWCNDASNCNLCSLPYLRESEIAC